MKYTAYVTLAVIASTVGVGSLTAQFTPAPPARPFPGFINEYFRSSDPYMSVWDIGGSARARYENKDNAGFTAIGSNWDFSNSPLHDNSNDYFLTRIMPHVGYTGKWFATYVETRSSFTHGDEREVAAAAGRGNAEEDGAVDFHQAYLFLGNHKEFPVSLKVGRQELAYGDQRLVGHFRWNNNARTFDAVKLRWQNSIFGVDVFSGGVVYNDNNNLNTANSQDHFSGVYFNFVNLGGFEAKQIVETYFLARNVQRGIVTDNWTGVAAPFRFPAPQDLYTAGLRLKSKPNAYGTWDYGLEAMYQFGNRTAVFPATPVVTAQSSKRLEQSAYAVIGSIGYTLSDHPWQPRLAFIYSYGSGDDNATDGKSSTFQNLFPTNHLFYGYMDLNSLQNIHDFRLALTAKPRSNISLALEAHAHFLADTADYWYNVAGVPRNVATAGNPVGSGNGFRLNPSYSNEVGQELDLVVGWSPMPWLQLEAGASHYFRGDYIKQSLAKIGSADANYLYLQATVTF